MLLKRGYLDSSRECFMEANIDNHNWIAKIFQLKMSEKFPTILEYPSELSMLWMKAGRFEKAEKLLRNIEKIWPKASLEKCFLGLDLKLKNLKKKEGWMFRLTRFK